MGISYICVQTGLDSIPQGLYFIWDNFTGEGGGALKLALSPCRPFVSMRGGVLLVVLSLRSLVSFGEGHLVK